ncbi:helix-turn-helix domain-containing protein [Zunongwangia pacifica]|uniref:Helix-turn-helix transcriptional regulator n=1 Tax=Zunongwangia pacifica TaxID=2911062 RepID=A0A9X2A4J5_9FLAO|nr:helix-turn-helix transcriptional regulator [Zunongwangia pacifica]MCL6220279.1 helix-turn-helix transcriptional regulator [Zunongwangia pacifica]
MDIGIVITRLRKDKVLSREELGSIVGTCGAVIGRYERNEITPSVEIANKIAQALDVSLDYLVGNNSFIPTDKQILDRVEAISNMPEDEQTRIFNVIDTLLRDYKAKKAMHKKPLRRVVYKYRS